MIGLLFSFAALATTGNGSVVMEKERNPAADSRAIVVSGNARFTVLTPAMIRMEWSPSGAFEDRASLAFVNRRLPVPEFTVERAEDRLAIQTGVLTLRYAGGGARFSEDNLTIEFMLNGKPVTWRPGLEDKGNLGGTYRTLDMVSGDVPLPPGLLSRDGWVVVDDSRRLLFDRHPGTRWPWATARPQESTIDWYFFGYGHDYRRALCDFTRIAGRIPLPPRFAFGTWWSRYWAYSDAELKQLVRGFDEHDVPLDVLVIDMDWHLDGWTGYTWSPKYFPDPDGFLHWVREQGLRATLNLHPADGVKKHEKAFADVARAMGQDPETTDHVPFDCADPRYVSAYFKYLHHPMERQGVDFWWIDWQQGEKTDIEGLDPLWWLNHLHWTDMERNPERAGRRPLLFSRWGGLGNHRYQIGFSGDTFCNWPSLAFQPYFTSTAGNVCYPYWSHDIGGHQPGPVEPELYARWIQWGAFSPMLRTHTTKNPKAERRIWEFPDEVFQAARKAFHLRYELIPYIYTAARQCYDTGLPLCRPLYYEWPELDEAYEYTGEYLFGDDLLVAPVTTPKNEISGYAEAAVWLPPGKWTNWFTGWTYEGPRRILLQVPLDEIPLFARDGAIIPAMPGMKRTNAAPVDPLILHIWPGTSGQTRVYEDDGESTGYQMDERAWTPVLHKLIDDQRQITIGPTEGSFPGMLKERTYEIHLRDVFVVPIEKVSVDGKPMARSDEARDSAWWYDMATLSVVIRLPKRLVTEPIQVTATPEVLEPDQVVARTKLGNGRRGLRRVLRDVATILDDRLLVEALGSDAYWDPVGANSYDLLGIWQPWGFYLGNMHTTNVDANRQQKALMRLLGLVCRFRAQASGTTENEIVLHTQVGISTYPDFEMLPPPYLTWEAQVALDAPQNWTVTSQRDSKTAERPLGEPVVVTTTLRPLREPQTTTLKGSVSLRISQGDVLPSDVNVPIRQVLLPSINRWWIVGPFPATLDEGLDKVFPPEEQIDLKATYDGIEGKRIGWRKTERRIAGAAELTEEFFVKLHDFFGGYHQNVVCYALTYLRAPEDMDATLALGSDDGVVVWLNGEEVHRNTVGRAYQPKEDRVPVHLKKGSNTLLLKVSQGGGDWSFCVHVETLGGGPLTSVTAHLQP